MQTPSIPDPKRAPMPLKARPASSPATPQKGLFRPLTATGLGFNAKRPGRRSLIGG